MGGRLDTWVFRVGIAIPILCIAVLVLWHLVNHLLGKLVKRRTTFRHSPEPPAPFQSSKGLPGQPALNGSALTGRSDAVAEAAAMRYFALSYEVAPDFLARRAPYREEHLRLAREAQGRGELVLAGALAEPADGALLIFRVAERSVVEDFARNDPYVTAGLVTRWQVRLWTVVIGNESPAAR
jgi:uncharacterized protein